MDVSEADYAREEHKWVTGYYRNQFEQLGPRPVEIQPSLVEPLRAVEQHVLNLARTTGKLVELQD